MGGEIDGGREGGKHSGVSVHQRTSENHHTHWSGPFELDLNWRCWWVEQLQILVLLDVGQTDQLKVRPELGTREHHWFHRF